MHEKWSERFIRIAKEVASWSKDGTGVGCVIVTPDKRILSTGYNGLPRGCDDNKEAYPERHTRPSDGGEKYAWAEHAERNAIYNAANYGVSVKGSYIYVTGFPCADCARAIIQSGIKKIYWSEPVDPSFTERWKDSIRISSTMFSEAQVQVIALQTHPVPQPPQNLLVAVS